MTRRPLTPEAAIENFRWYLTTQTPAKERTVNDYCATLKVIVRFFRKEGRDCLPWEITQGDVLWLLDSMIERNLKVATRKSYITPLKLWCSYYKNEEPSKLKIRWPKDMRPNADWLREEQARDLLAQEMEPFEELFVHCELCLGMRRIEVLRLTIQSFKGSYVNILGKGPQDGKPRLMPYHRDTAMVLARYMRYRQSVVALATSKKPRSTIVPEDLLIYLKGHTIKTYSEKGSGPDAWLKRLGQLIGYVMLSNHTLRRTFGRTMYRSIIARSAGPNREAALVVVGVMMGIEDVRVLIDYLGINLDDMAEAMEVFAL